MIKNEYYFSSSSTHKSIVILIFCFYYLLNYLMPRQSFIDYCVWTWGVKSVTVLKPLNPPVIIKETIVVPSHITSYGCYVSHQPIIFLLTLTPEWYMPCLCIHVTIVSGNHLYTIIHAYIYTYYLYVDVRESARGWINKKGVGVWMRRVYVVCVSFFQWNLLLWSLQIILLYYPLDFGFIPGYYYIAAIVQTQK